MLIKMKYNNNKNYSKQLHSSVFPLHEMLTTEHDNGNDTQPLANLIKNQPRNHMLKSADSGMKRKPRNKWKGKRASAGFSPST